MQFVVTFNRNPFGFDGWDWTIRQRRSKAELDADAKQNSSELVAAAYRPWPATRTAASAEACSVLTQLMSGTELSGEFRRYAHTHPPIVEEI